MDFIVDNYFWFIIGGIVVLMLIIGFIAEQTDFGRKPFSKKKESVNKPEVKEEPQETANDEIAIVAENNDFNGFALDEGLEEIGLSDNVTEQSEVVFDDAVKNEDTSLGVDYEMMNNSIPGVDIPKIDTNEEADPVTADLVEEVVSDAVEDDVWKF